MKKFLLGISATLLLTTLNVLAAGIPDLSKAFTRKQTFMISKYEDGPNLGYHFATNDSFDIIKEQLLEALGEGWAPVERHVAARKDNPLGVEKKEDPTLLGDIRLANPKFKNIRITLALFNTPIAKFNMKHSMMLSVENVTQ